ncbi:MAG: hypothetical protein ABJC87_03205, partial [Roseobacter sp.]
KRKRLMWIDGSAKLLLERRMGRASLDILRIQMCFFGMIDYSPTNKWKAFYFVPFRPRHLV